MAIKLKNILLEVITPKPEKSDSKPTVESKY